MELHTKLQQLTDSQLIQLSEELRLPTVADDALIREVIKGTDVDSIAPMLAFIAVSQNLAFVLADRLIFANIRINQLENEIEGIASHGDESY